MTGVQDIENALIALWKGKTGATPQAVMRQPALMGLGQVVAHARDQAGVDQSTDDEVANACRECIHDACEHWTERPDSPDIARLLLGVARGSRGATRRVRRQRIETLYDVKVEWLTHKREGSSPETRAIEVVAAALADGEGEHQKLVKAARQHVDLEHLDFISPSIGADFQCLGYRVELVVTGEVCVLVRQLSLVSICHRARLCAFHDGWGSTDTSYSCVFGTSKDWPLGHIVQDAMKTPVLPLDLYEEFSSGDELDLQLCTRYNSKDICWGEQSDYGFGVFANPDGRPIPCSLVAQLADCEKVTTRTVSHGKRAEVEEEKELSGIDGFFALDSEVLPGTSYALHWQVTPQKTELHTSKDDDWEDGWLNFAKRERPTFDN